VQVCNLWYATKVTDPPKCLQPPKNLFSVPGKYASALFVAAAKANKLEVVGQELLQVEQLIKTNPEFRAFLKDPVIPPPIKQKGLEDFFKAAGASEITKNFFGASAFEALMFLSSRVGCCWQVVFQQEGPASLALSKGLPPAG
jgi:hypothetical protein